MIRQYTNHIVAQMQHTKDHDFKLYISCTSLQALPFKKRKNFSKHHSCLHFLSMAQKLSSLSPQLTLGLWENNCPTLITWCFVSWDNLSLGMHRMDRNQLVNTFSYYILFLYVCPYTYLSWKSDTVGRTFSVLFSWGNPISIPGK